MLGYSCTFLLLASGLLTFAISGARASDIASDYVIVGAGPSGYVLATRLSEDPGVTVTLLEAGPDGEADPQVFTPAFAGNLQGTKYAWNFTSQPDPKRGNIAPPLAQGHVLGGGSSINFMAYCRGASSVFDEWANISGIKGLRFDNLLQQYKLSSNLTIPEGLDYVEAANASVYGNGPVQVSYEVEEIMVEPFWGNAVAETVTQPITVIDPTDGRGIGQVNGGPHAINLETGHRTSAQTSYGSIIATRSNVKILSQTVATKINFSGKQAVSVDYVSELDNFTHTITATREVMVTAGTFGSPKLLMLSGIGPRDVLENLNISVIQDVPELGRNLHDHQSSVVMVQIPEDIITSFTVTENATLLAELEIPYQANGTGPLSTILGSSFVMERPSDDFLDSINASFHKALPKDRPLLLYEYASSPFVSDPTEVNVISAFVALVQPEASGHMSLASADYRDNPLIFSNYWGSDADLALELYGYKKLREAMASRTSAPVVIGEIYPGVNVTTDEELIQAMVCISSSLVVPFIEKK
jgi:choline dehydrogenase